MLGICVIISLKGADLMSREDIIVNLKNIEKYIKEDKKEQAIFYINKIIVELNLHEDRADTYVDELLNELR